MAMNSSPLVAQGLCLRNPRDQANHWPCHPSFDLWGAESGSFRDSFISRGALARSVRLWCVCACVRVCAALTCRLLTEVFVCTQASELRGPPALPLATLRAAPLSQAPLGPRCVSLPPAHRPSRFAGPDLSQPSLPFLAHPAPWGSPWAPVDPPSPSGYVAVQARRPTEGLSAGKGQP